MYKRLTLSISKEHIEISKKIARKRKISLSQFVEGYFVELGKMEQSVADRSDSIYRELAGIINTGSPDILSDIFGRKKR
jgi:hypothetical protein